MRRHGRRHGRRLGRRIASHREGDPAAVEIDLDHGDLHPLMHPHDRGRIADEPVGEAAHVDEPVLVDSDIDERAECGHVGDDARELHSRLQVFESWRHLRRRRRPRTARGDRGPDGPVPSGCPAGSAGRPCRSGSARDRSDCGVRRRASVRRSCSRGRAPWPRRWDSSPGGRRWHRAGGLPPRMRRNPAACSKAFGPEARNLPEAPPATRRARARCGRRRCFRPARHPGRKRSSGAAGSPCSPRPRRG